MRNIHYFLIALLVSMMISSSVFAETFELDLYRPTTSTLLYDPTGKVSVSGVPHFIISDADGKIIKAVAGAPGGAQPPWNERQLAQLAALYDLP